MPFIVNRTNKRMSVRLANDKIVTIPPNGQLEISDEDSGSTGVARMMHGGHLVVAKEPSPKKKVIENKAKKTGKTAVTTKGAAKEKKPKAKK